MCIHLTEIEKDMAAAGIQILYRGQPWTDNCREWIYFDCYLDTRKLIEKYNLPDFVEVHVNNDVRSGKEAGICCSSCHDAIIGAHPDHKANKIIYP
jgi:hypothetical protein